MFALCHGRLRGNDGLLTRCVFNIDNIAAKIKINSRGLPKYRRQMKEDRKPETDDREQRTHFA